MTSDATPRCTRALRCVRTTYTIPAQAKTKLLAKAISPVAPAPAMARGADWGWHDILIQGSARIT